MYFDHIALLQLLMRFSTIYKTHVLRLFKCRYRLSLLPARTSEYQSRLFPQNKDFSQQQMELYYLCRAYFPLHYIPATRIFIYHPILMNIMFMNMCVVISIHLLFFGFVSRTLFLCMILCFCSLYLAR